MERTICVVDRDEEGTSLTFAPQEFDLESVLCDGWIYPVPGDVILGLTYEQWLDVPTGLVHVWTEDGKPTRVEPATPSETETTSTGESG